VLVDPALYRPAEVDLLHADASKARRCLRWQAEVGFEQLVRLMMDADLALLAGHDTALPGAAFV
jgi:GDPmannose 4,6-dehydratase